jgi:HEAT repeat protein
LKVARDPRFRGDEIRQAAIWGLGKFGLKAYDELRHFIDDLDDNVAMHAIVAFGSDTPPVVIDGLVADLGSPIIRRAAAASEALRKIATKTAVQALARTAKTGNNWVIATLGRLPPELVREHLKGSDALAKVEPLLLLNQDTNWLTSENRVLDVTFLSKQDIVPLDQDRYRPECFLAQH